MMLGPDRILACPRCGALVRVMTLWSGNTFGATYYTDGSMRAPMLPETPAIAKCQGCGAGYWLDDAVVVWDPKGGTPEQPELRERAAPVESPSEDLLAEALVSGLATNREKEIYLRVRLWWNGGQRCRDATATDDETPRHLKNMESLVGLLDEADANERLMKAELARHLGRFDEARRLIDHPFDPGARHHVAAISRLIEQRRTEVAVVRGTEGLTEDDRRQMREAAERACAESQAREARRQAFVSQQESAREQGLLKDGDRCPRCGFSYAWNGTDCHHCHDPATRA